MALSIWKFKLKYTAIHLVVSALIAAAAAWLIYRVWYPFPFVNLMAVGPVFGMAVIAGVVCGPLITAVLANPTKSRRERMIDFSLVGFIQLAALVWAVHTVYVVRPVAVVFEVDRFVVVSANEVLVEQLPQPDVSVERLPVASRLLLGTRQRRADEDLMQSVQLSLAGVGPATRPSWWVPYAQVRSGIAQKARPLADLLAARPNQRVELERSIAMTGLSSKELRFLPLTTSRNKNWVVLLNDRQELAAYAPVDGFLQPAVSSTLPDRQGN